MQCVALEHTFPVWDLKITSSSRVFIFPLHKKLASCEETVKNPGLVAIELADSAVSSIMMEASFVGVLCGTAENILRTRI